MTPPIILFILCIHLIVGATVEYFGFGVGATVEIYPHLKVEPKHTIN